MGKLRIEPKVKPLLNEKEYNFYKSILEEARTKAQENRIFWDLEPGENPRKARKAFLHVAEKEGINLRIVAKRDKNCLFLNFQEGKSSGRQGRRMPAEESRERILNALRTSKSPMKRSQIIKKAEISPSNWNIRVRELLKKGSVAREGTGRNTRYYIP